MIYGRGKRFYGGLVLVACDAARNFVRGKRARGSSSLWCPLALRWRRRRTRSEHVSTSHGVSGAQVFWFPQFHLHYATQRNDRTRSAGLVALTPGPQVSETRVVVDRHWTSIRSFVVTPRASRAERTSRQFHSTPSLRTTRSAALVNTPRSLLNSERSIQSPKTNRVYLTRRPFYLPERLRQWGDAGATNTQSSLRTSGHSITGMTGSRPRVSQLGRIPELARKGKQTEKQIPFVIHSQIWRQWLQIFGSRPSAPRDLISSNRKEHKYVPVQFDRAEELVWRRARRHALTENADPESRQEFSSSHEQPVLRSFQSQAAAHVPSFAQPAIQQITKLDPGVLDRLADDVIRRVEQRVRIERERRGL